MPKPKPKGKAKSKPKAGVKRRRSKRRPEQIDTDPETLAAALFPVRPSRMQIEQD